MGTEKAKDIILNRVMVEVFLAHNAIAVYVALSDHSQPLNASRFKRTLGFMQRHAFDSFVLSICRLFEKPSERYPNFSIPTALNLLQQSRTTLTQGIQNPALLEEFIRSRIDSRFVAINQNQIERIPAILLDYFSNECPRTPPREEKELDIILDALKVLRDKCVAHHEDTDLSSLSKTDLDGALRLLSFANTLVNLVGYGLFGFSMHSEVTADHFEPSKSVVWPEINRMIEILEP